MEENRAEKFQYTFRVLDSHHQFIEMAYSEVEARENLAKILLSKEGISKENSEYEQKLITIQEKLKLVYIR